MLLCIALNGSTSEILTSWAVSSGNILAVNALCCVTINLLSWSARVLIKSFSSHIPTFSSNGKRKQWSRGKDAVWHGVHSSLILICCQHTFRHGVVVPQFWWAHIVHIFHLKGKCSASLVLEPSKHEFRWKIWLGCYFRVTSACFHTSVVDFASSRRFLICVCFKVSGPCCVNSQQPWTCVTCIYLPEKGPRNKELPNGSIALQRCSVVLFPWGTKKLSGFISVLNAYILLLHVTLFSTPMPHTCVFC